MLGHQRLREKVQDARTAKTEIERGGKQAWTLEREIERGKETRTTKMDICARRDKEI